MKNAIFKASIYISLAACWQTSSVVHAQTGLSETVDCTEIDISASIDEGISRQENLQRLSQQFSQSVNQIDHCDRDTSDATSADGTDGADGEGEDAGAGEDASETNDASEDTETTSSGDSPSTASSTVTGTASSTATATTKQDPASDPIEATASGSLIGTNQSTTPTTPITSSDPVAASDIGGTTPAENTAELDDPQQGIIRGGDNPSAPLLTNGKIPDDIPDEDNDSVFETQIRAAAMAETDPDIQKNLWNEYRRYKGLAERN